MNSNKAYQNNPLNLRYEGQVITCNLIKLTAYFSSPLVVLEMEHPLFISL